ncbi:AsnC family transcriptional regulator [Massilia sp. JS1662]|jgi:Lrp/AsnC family transcriptional regulator, leucine-responsive regulatory protein|nr:winged helix-turn-helix transcriptional regulator [Massilia sp. JS1662]KGF81693.1 AsnC family transcriptional regulator [Massilia sp. JS1662]MCS0613640.1 winged helix-turn-helix transcriptional regulator [Massilia kyonggiensis]
MRVQKDSNRVLDRIDLHILSILQDDGRIVMKDLAERVGLSLTPCIERVKRMERDGVIAGYHARVAPRALGLQILVFVEITLRQKSEQAFERFRRAMLSIPEVMECHLVSGDFDYLIKARIPEMTEYRRLLGEILHVADGGQSKSYVVMEEVKETLAVSIAR